MRYRSMKARFSDAALAHEIQQEKPAKRKSARKRGYDSAWEKLRARIANRAARDPAAYCELCGQGFELHNTKAIHVDHRERISDAPHRRLDEANLRPVHAGCHSRLTAQEDQAAERGFTLGTAADGTPTDPRHPYNRGGRR